MTTEQVEISQGRKLSGIWFIPLLALVLGLYMVVHNWMTEGPEIQIAFKTASGLEQGKTKVKYRSVNMGIVEEVHLNDDFDGVIATVKLDRRALPLLREDTRFWVVTARVGVGNISGLDTLLSGAYIQLSPGEGKKEQRKFVALEQPPLTPAGAPGLRLQLTSDRSSSISAGDAVLYTGYKVGRVESMKFDPDDRKLHYTLFIDAPYHNMVDSQTRFWDVSGISLSAGADGFKVETGSVDTILLGGVAFGLPPGISRGVSVENDTEFRLYSSYDDILQNPFRFGSHYVISFSQSIKGLLPGAPVEYRGIAIGKVEKILLKESMEYNIQQGTQGRGAAIPVLVYLEPGRLELPDQESSVGDMHKAIRSGVENGMRASLETGSLLTGAKYINIDYFQDIEKAGIGSFLEHPTIPSIETGLEQIEHKLNAILDKINALPLNETVTGANKAVATLNETLDSLHTIMENPSINSSLLRLNQTLGNMESLTRTLSGKPNAAILPYSPIPDPVPEVKQ